MKTALVRLKAKDTASFERLQSSLKNLKQLSRNEPGAVSYEIFLSLSDTLVCFVKESWSDEPSFQKHVATPHLKKFGEDTALWLSEPFSIEFITELV